MVIIQPFVYQKTTAFKERVELANKLNEIIEIFNDVDIESKINEFNNQIEIINGKISQIDNALVEVDNAVQTVEGYDSRLTSVETISNSNKSRLDNVEPRLTTTENRSINNTNEINAIKNNSMVIGGSKSFIIPNAGGYLMGGIVSNTIPDNNYVRLFRLRGYSQQDIVIYGTVPNNGLGYIHIILGGSDQFDRSYLLNSNGTFNTIINPFLARIAVSGWIELWIRKTTAFTKLKIVVLHCTASLVGVELTGEDTGLNELPAIGETHPITNEIITGVTGFNH